MIEIRPSKLIQKVAEQLIKMEEVSYLTLTTGTHSIEIDVLCRDNEHLLEVMHGAVNDIEDVQNTDVNIFLKVHSDSGSFLSQDGEVENLDEKDLEIIKYIKEDSRKSFTDMVKEMKSSVGMIRKRYNELVKKKIILVTGWVDPCLLGLKSYSRALIYMNDTSKIDDAIKILNGFEEVVFVATTTGKHALEVNWLCRDDKHLYEERNNLINTINGVENSELTIYLKVLKVAGYDTGNSVITPN